MQANATTINYVGCYRQSDSYKSDPSRRSIDWRDSGIVIDEDNHLFETLCNFETRSSIYSADLDYPSYASTSTSVPTTATTATPATPATPATGYPSQQIVSDPDDDGDTILHLAVVGFTHDKVKDLISLCDLNAINNMMQTPLHVAVMANRPEMVQLLVASHAQMNIHDRRGNTPLHIACQGGHTEIAELILNSIASKQQEGLTVKSMIESFNFDGYTCLHLAAINDKRNIIQLLVEKYGANLNCRDSKSGETIIHKAIRQFNIDLVAFILDISEEQHCNGVDFAGREPLDTIQILKDAQPKDAAQLKTLIKFEELIEAGIRRCILRQGCCNEATLARINNLSTGSDYSSSSSDYSDSDYDMH